MTTNQDRRVCLITGAASGIGRATAYRLGRSADRLVLVDRDEEQLTATVNSLRSAGGTALGHVADLAVPDAVAGAVQCAIDEFGRLDVLASIAGIGQFGPATEIGLDEWERVLTVNLRAPFLLARAALPHLVVTRGVIVAVSSIAGLQGWPYAAAYAASKGGLVTLMRTLAVEYGARGVRVNVVAPGSVDTGMSAGMRTPDFDYDESVRKRSLGLQGRRADPDELAAAIEFLAAPDASFVSGSVLRVDGGAFA